MTQSGELTVTKIRVAHRLAEIEAINNLWEEWSRDLFMNRFLFHEAQQGKPVWRQLEGFQTRTEQHLEQLGTLVGQLSSALYEDTTRLEMITDGLEEEFVPCGCCPSPPFSTCSPAWCATLLVRRVSR